MKRLIYLPLLLALSAGFGSCQRDDLFLDEEMDPEVERTDNLPIRLEVAIGDPEGTRSVENAKKEFTSGDIELGIPADIIHVQSTFEWFDKDAQTTVTEQRYCALELTEEGKWVPKGIDNFAWPNKAEKGWFTAYYIPGSTGELTPNVSEKEFTPTRKRFSDIIDGEDPLRAQTPQDEPFIYGHTVTLTFEHILTHLTLIELDAGIDENLIFRVPKDESKSDSEETLANAFEIKLLREEGQNPQISFDYFSVPEKLKENDPNSELGFLIKAPTELVRDPKTRLESREVGFFLQPDQVYNSFSVYFSNGDRHLSYTNSDPEADRKLLGNNRYTFNVKKSSGVTIHSQPEQKWDESDDYTTVVDAGKFLQAIHSNSAYSEWDEEKQEEVQILERTTNPVGTLLKRNIRFQTPYYHVFTYSTDDQGNPVDPYDFQPTVGSDNVFDGGYHYIKGLCCPLFYENSGTIKNLGFLDVTIGNSAYGPWISQVDYTEEKMANPPYQYNRTGAIANNNNGTVQNIRVKNLSVNVEIHAPDEQESHRVGALFGDNNASGYVEQIHLSGVIEVTVKQTETSAVVPEVSIGGLAGQNLGMMTDIGQLVDNREELEENQRPQPVHIKVTNQLNHSYGSYYVGGLVGNNTGKLNEISIPTTEAAVTVDSSQSFGVVSYIGGIAGQAGSSQGNEISSCLIGSGSVQAGRTSKFQNISAYSYTGGMVGLFSERTIITNCTSFCSVIGSIAQPGDGVVRAAGGVFGMIEKITTGTPGNMSAIAAFGDALSGTDAGCFAGEVATGKTWEDFYQNYVDVKKFEYDYIGISVDKQR